LLGFLFAGKNILELIHPGIGKENRGVIERDYRR